MATKMLAAGGADVTADCAFTVVMAISFHFVISLAEAAIAGMASATARPTTATPANSSGVHCPRPLLTPSSSVEQQLPATFCKNKGVSSVSGTADWRLGLGSSRGQTE